MQNNQITRARALVIHNDCLLLMKRVKAGFEYYTLPGGKVEANEMPDHACVREIFEETTLNIEVIREVARDYDIFNDIANTHIIFLCRYIDGIPVLSGEEKDRSTPENYYEPLWVEKDKISTLVIRPELQLPFILSALEIE